MNRLQIPEYVLSICNTLRDAGHEAYVVGGGVRDALLGRIPKDWDVATDAPPERVQQLFPRTVPTGIQFGTVTVLVSDRDRAAADVECNERASSMPEGHEQAPPDPSGDRRALPEPASFDRVRAVEVTTFRGESGYADGRRPDEVRFIGSIENDLVRRDFTVNAIAYDPFGATIVDPHGGSDDLERRLIRAVGDPDERFREDGLRVLRAVRLATELGFDIEPATGLALKRNGPALRHISRERIGQEWRRIITAAAAGRGLQLLAQFDLLPYIFVVASREPEAADMGAGTETEAQAVPRQSVPSAELISRIAAALDRLHEARAMIADDETIGVVARGSVARSAPGSDAGPFAGSDDDVVTPTAIVLHGLGSPADHRGWLRNLVYSKQNLRAAVHVTEALSALDPRQLTTDGDLRRFLSKLGRPNITPFFRAWSAWHAGDDAVRVSERVARIVADNDALATNELALDGNDVLQVLGRPPGPFVGEVLERLLAHVLEHPEDNDRERLTTLLMGWAKDDHFNLGLSRA